METSIHTKITNYFASESDTSTLAFFRICFGTIMCISMIRFWYLGWIEKLYLTPTFQFKYKWMDWVVVPGVWTYGLFLLCGLSALFVALGYRYRISSIVFFLSFTYIELMDKTTYLNHYYLISILAFLMILLPAESLYSLDAARQEKKRQTHIPSWMIGSLRVMIAIVYLSAGLAKLNPDWMFNAMPLSIWLQSKTDLPIIGQVMHQPWLHTAFSWGGAIYDLCIVPLLLLPKTRVLAFIAVVVFHVLTRILFPIGMFPFIMIAASLLFIQSDVHRRVLDRVSKFFGLAVAQWGDYKPLIQTQRLTWIKWLVGGFLLIQIMLPLRSHILTDNVYWTERGYRFSWRVMLMEKAGQADFKIVNVETGKRFYVNNADFLTGFQQKQMATQPDFILEYGHHLGKHFASQGHENVGVFVESYVALNGRPSQKYIDPEVDLMQLDYSTLVESHILPLREK